MPDKAASPPLRNRPSFPAAVLPGWRIIAVFAGLLVLLPIAVWLDLRDMAERSLLSQAADLDAVITSIRDYYADHIVARIVEGGNATPVIPDYETVPGAIPIPATLSIELARVIDERQHGLRYRFVSDYPFKNRAPHPLDKFETAALATLRQRPGEPVYQFAGSLSGYRLRYVAPVIMTAPCVSCHNTHPDSPKRDWRIGDVRGIQEISLAEPILSNALFSRYLFLYFLLTAAVGFFVFLYQRRQAAAFQRIAQDLEGANSFLKVVADKIAKYFPPQIYERIFSGERDVKISTERKKLTIFFSDIKDFTALAERMQPEELTQLLNEYLTEMSAIAASHGATVNKFIGDAMLVFFGDPESKGVAEDAQDCVGMAFEMQRRLAELNAKWRGRGIEQPFRVRMGINTGFCNVGNFGSDDRMDYTIIGAEANLAARLQSIAEPGTIVISYETYAVVRDHVVARALPPITMKGIGRAIVPYMVENLAARGRVLNEHSTGLDLFLDLDLLDQPAAARLERVLNNALSALKAKREPPPAAATAPPEEPAAG